MDTYEAHALTPVLQPNADRTRSRAAQLCATLVQAPGSPLLGDFAAASYMSSILLIVQVGQCMLYL